MNVKHRSAPGRGDELWEYDDAERVIRVVAILDGFPFPFRVALCSFARPELGAHPLNRIDGETWRVLPQRFVREWPNGIETLRPIDCPIVDELGDGCGLTLTHCPPHVSDLLEKL